MTMLSDIAQSERHPLKIPEITCSCRNKNAFVLAHILNYHVEGFVLNLKGLFGIVLRRAKRKDQGGDKMKTYLELQKALNVSWETDVVVTGGGTADIAALLAVQNGVAPNKVSL